MPQNYPWARPLAFAYPPPLQPCITSFPLTSHCQYENRINRNDIAIQRHIPARAATDHQLAISRGFRTTDQGIAFQRFDCSDDVPQPRRGVLYFVLSKVAQYPVEVIGNLRRQLDAGHRQGASLRTPGRAGRSPSMVCSR